ncbi:hypothetical protein V4F39_05775 [Aquincola sp. MAHUQ-54]|uniref:CHAP domain-containing protein n=1 Tax=Aquincola agrisoli TaxID=3119538 RepID=A0AAW9QEE7_9BURK
MSNPVIDKLIDLAHHEVGVREGVVNNTGARIEEYQGATWLQPGAWPWCAAFTCWLMREVLEDEAARQSLAGFMKRDSISFAQAEKLRCRDASAFGWEKWARAAGVQVLDERQLARRGDFIVFDFSHIGVVVDDQRSPGDLVQTIEGNTNGKGERDSTSGDGVWRKARAPSLTRSYIRIFH